MLSRFFLHPAAEAFCADDGALVQTAHDDLVRIAGFNLERDLAVFHGDHLGAAMNRLPHGRGGQVADIKLEADGTFIGVEMRVKRVARGALEKLEDVWRGHDCGHAVAVKFHGVLHVGGNGQFPGFSHFGA